MAFNSFPNECGNIVHHVTWTPPVENAYQIANNAQFLPSQNLMVPNYYNPDCVSNQAVLVQNSPIQRMPPRTTDGGIFPVEYPDGSVKYHFIPKDHQILHPDILEMTNQSQQLQMPTTPFWVQNPNSQSLNLQQQIALKQLKQKILETQLHSEMMKSLPPYMLKFHNDATTSTTDLIYFFPALKNSSCFDSLAKLSIKENINLNSSVLHSEEMQVEYPKSNEIAGTSYSIPPPVSDEGTNKEQVDKCICNPANHRKVSFGSSLLN